MQGKEFEGKNVEEATERACQEWGVTAEQLEIDVTDEGRAGILGMGARPVTIKARLKNPPEVAKGKAFLEQLLPLLGVTATIRTEVEAEQIVYDVETPDSALLIGRRGQTLEALQHILHQVARIKGMRTVVDVAGYREKHRQKLEEMAERIAEKVRSTKKRVELEPMSASDRRVVHTAISRYDDLATLSIGTEPRRRIVVSLAKNEQ